MLQDELGGVGFVLAVVHVHLELIGLSEKEEDVMIIRTIRSNQYIFIKKHLVGNMEDFH